MRRARVGLAALLAVVLLTAGCLGNPANLGRFFDGSTHTEPNPETGTCTNNDTGEVDVTVDNTVIDDLCLDGGTLVIDADNVTVQNSILKASAPTFGFAIYVLDGSDNVTIRYNNIDCQGGLNEPDAAVIGIGGNSNTSGLFTRNEVAHCSDGINAQSNWTYSFNLINQPYNCDIVNVCDIHADGVQGQTEDDGSNLHDMLFEWNNIDYPHASSSFQFHNSAVPSEGWANVIVRYNQFRGGAAVLRLPSYDNGGLKLYGNRIGRLFPTPEGDEFFVCTPFANGTDPIDVWGRETGSTADYGNDGVFDDDNVNIEDGTTLTREECE